MRKEIQQFLAVRPDLQHFVRMNPQWYRRLGRCPHDVKEMEEEAKRFYGKTIPQRIQRLNQQLKMAQFMIGMLQYYNQSKTE
ncbi:MAG TPA: YlbE-like family protein [Bacillales bacterium]|nr:YlbE-like family protein [Bacillales bacterium]